MSEERGKRDDGTPESADSGLVDESTVSDQPANGQVTAEESPTSAAPAGKPSGKRAARRGGTDTAEPVETVKPAVAASSTKSTKSRSASSAESKSGDNKPRKADKPRTENIFKRLRRFLREVIAELRKVIWPNRKQMITYTSVVLVFVAFMVTFISLLDLGFIKGVSWLFG
ncbi:preprotein translocase subunit SecE [Prescottella soli]|uniref:Protein translocase subunit SecE n=1 Tax=Prescottella soli TaxID=1543852 RepID=A0ABW9FY84_9NOCA